MNYTIGPADVDTQLLVWDMRRPIHLDRLLDRWVVVQVEFRGARAATFWLLLQRPEPSVCLHDPGFPVDLLVAADTVALHRVWMGRLAWADALRAGLIEIVGPRTLARAFPTWLALNVFAAVPPAVRSLASSPDRRGLATSVSLAREISDC